MKELDSLNKYQVELFNYIQQYHTYLMDNKDELDEILIIRASNAQDEFLKSIQNGKTPIEAQEDANNVLYAGLHFSPITWLLEIYYDNKGEETDMENAYRIYNQSKHLFEKYQVNDDFVGSDLEEKLIEEILPYL